MQKARFTQYAAVGVQAMPGMRMNVRGNVCLPDSEAGTGQEMRQEPYRAASAGRRRPRRHVMVPAWAGVIFLTAVFLLFGGLIIGKMVRRVEVVRSIETMRQEIAHTLEDNEEKSRQVLEARNSVRICYEAVQRLGMVAATDVQTISITAPLTRPVQPITVTADAQESSPLSAPEGIMSGSR